MRILGKHKKKKMTLILIILVIFFLFLHCCNKPKTTIQDPKEYEQFVDQQHFNVDEILLELELWLSELDLEKMCQPEVQVGFDYYAEALLKEVKRFHLVEYIGKETIASYEEVQLYFEVVQQFGEKMDELSQTKTNQNAIQLLKELIEIQIQMKELRGTFQ